MGGSGPDSGRRTGLDVNSRVTLLSEKPWREPCAPCKAEPAALPAKEARGAPSVVRWRLAPAGAELQLLAEPKEATAAAALGAVDERVEAGPIVQEVVDGAEDGDAGGGAETCPEAGP